MRITAQDGALQVLELHVLIEPELLDQPVMHAAVQAQRVGCPPVPVHGQHVQRDQPLAVRVLRGQLDQLIDDRALPAQA